MFIPLELFCLPVVIVQSAAFGSYPYIPPLVLCHAADDGIGQSFAFILSGTIVGVDFIFGVEVVRSAKIGSHPHGTLMVFDDTVDR